MKNAEKLNKVSHAYIFSGEKSSGKKLLASRFAELLQCEGEGEKPCGKCRSCRQAESGNHPDIIRITHEKPNTISVDDIREQLVGDVQIKPYQSKYKIYIVPDAEKMNVQAQNALLKTIEEPPAYAVILFLTTNASSFLPTILSRCVVLNIKPVPDQEVRKYLMEHVEVPDYQADIAVAFAQGNIGKAVKLATSEYFNEIKNAALHILKNAPRMDISEISAAVKGVSEYLRGLVPGCAVFQGDPGCGRYHFPGSARFHSGADQQLQLRGSGGHSGSFKKSKGAAQRQREF